MGISIKNKQKAGYTIKRYKVAVRLKYMFLTNDTILDV
jgi:hypothetical protein